MDYDKTEIPTMYDKARVLSPETRRLWQDLLSVHIGRAAVSLIIDLGCGTGRFSELLAGHFSAQVIGARRVHYKCASCGLSEHETDAVHCKPCGTLLHLTT